MGGGMGGNFGNTKGSRGKAALPTHDSQLKHIFGERKGHLTDTSTHRKLLTDTANNNKNFKGIDKYGNSWHIANDKKGRQIWVRSRKGIINEGGRNDTPIKWNKETGLYKNPIKRNKSSKKKGK